MQTDTQESRTLDDAKLLVVKALEIFGLPEPIWRDAAEGTLGQWQFTDFDFGGLNSFSIGISGGGVVSVDGRPHSPIDGKLNITLSRVIATIESKFGHCISRFDANRSIKLNT